MIYLIHFDRPISPDHTTRHYIGFSEMTPEARLEIHKRGHGARLTGVANERGIDYRIVRAWFGDRTLERKLKNQKSGPSFCPICQEKPRTFQVAKEMKL